MRLQSRALASTSRGQCMPIRVREANPDGPEWQQPGPSGVPGPARSGRRTGRGLGGDAVTGGKGIAGPLPGQCRPSQAGSANNWVAAWDLFTAKAWASSIELADGGDRPPGSSQMR